jgi:hypothetical protein
MGSAKAPIGATNLKTNEESSMLKPWSIRHLYDAMQGSLAACHTDFERINVRAICGKEIREQAEQFAKERKLTPGEIAIASQFGYKG